MILFLFIFLMSLYLSVFVCGTHKKRAAHHTLLLSKNTDVLSWLCTGHGEKRFFKHRTGNFSVTLGNEKEVEWNKQDQKKSLKEHYVMFYHWVSLYRQKIKMKIFHKFKSEDRFSEINNNISWYCHVCGISRLCGWEICKFLGRNLFYDYVGYKKGCLFF